MEIYCTRQSCPRPVNFFADLDDSTTLKTVQQKYCTTCGMPLILYARYVPSKLLGRGGFGAAFLARDRGTPSMRHCVVKQFQPSGNLTPQQLQIAQNLFEREGAVLEELGTHPQIPDLYAFFDMTVSSFQAGKQDKFFYLVQEFIDGQNLEEELATKGKFSENEVLVLLREILPVLKFVHDNGSIHRDIKLSNIMRDRRERLYLLDFGAVKQITKGAPSSGGQAGSSTGIYSMGFAPPEQMSGGQVYPSTDLYALAVTCVTLLTGKQPMELYDGYNNQWNWRPQALVSDRLADILDRMLLPTPNQRFESAEVALFALTPETRVSPPPNPQPPPLPVTRTGGMPIPQTPSRAGFSLVEILGGAAFIGFEGALLAIALRSLVRTPAISIGLVGMILGGSIYAQYRRIIKGKALLIIAGITLFVVFLLLRNQIEFALVVAIVAGAGAIAVTALFRLIYNLLSSFL